MADPFGAASARSAPSPGTTRSSVARVRGLSRCEPPSKRKPDRLLFGQVAAAARHALIIEPELSASGSTRNGRSLATSSVDRFNRNGRRETD
jgi:hypothetical protein